jgi:hypothetical protein
MPENCAEAVCAQAGRARENTHRLVNKSLVAHCIKEAFIA